MPPLGGELPCPTVAEPVPLPAVCRVRAVHHLCLYLGLAKRSIDQPEMLRDSPSRQSGVALYTPKPA